MLKFSVTQEISEVKTQAGDGAQLMGHWPRVLTLTVNLTTYSHLRERDCLEKIYLWAYLWGTTFTVNDCKKAQPTVGRTIPWSVVLGYIRQLAKHRSSSQPASTVAAVLPHQWVSSRGKTLWESKLPCSGFLLLFYWWWPVTCKLK